MDNLSIKYRPLRFDNVYEQDSIKKVLTRHIEISKPSPVYVFSGIRGCGKHTMAHILANGLNQCIMDVPEFIGDTFTMEDVNSFINSPITKRFNICIINRAELLSSEVAQFLLEHYKNKHNKYIFILLLHL